MSTLDSWQCSNCGGNVRVDAVDRAGVYRCEFCGAVLTAPSAPSVRCDVRLEDAGGMPPAVIKLLASYSSLAIARDLVRQAPSIVRRDVTQEEAEQLRQRLMAAGARVSVIQGGALQAQVRAPAVPDPIVLGGTPWFEGTEVQALRSGDDTVLARALVQGARFELAIATGGVPVPLSLAIRQGGQMPMVIHHNHPLTRSRALGSALPRPRELYGAFARILGTPLVAGTGLLWLRAVHDEMGGDLAGVTFWLSVPGLRISYIDDRGGLTPAQEASGKYGCAFVLNVPPGPVQVTAGSGGESWAPVSVGVAPDVVTEVVCWR